MSSLFSVAALCFENNDDILYKIVLLAIIAVAIGIILTLKNIAKAVNKNKIHLPKINKNEILDCKYILCDKDIFLYKFIYYNLTNLYNNFLRIYFKLMRRYNA